MGLLLVGFLLVLIDKAKVINDGNTTEGEKIVYDTVKQIASAGRANCANVTAPRPRIDMLSATDSLRKIEASCGR